VSYAETDMSKAMDQKPMSDFERELLESVDRALRGEVAAVHTLDTIAARRRGRPLGSVQAIKKRSTTIRFDAACSKPCARPGRAGRPASMRRRGSGWGWGRCSDRPS